MIFLHFIEKISRPIAHLSTAKLGMLFTISILTSAFIALIPHPSQDIQKNSASVPSHISPSPIPEAASSSPVLSASIASSDVPITSAKPIKEVGISVGESLLGLSDSDLNTRLNDFKSLGITWIRADLSWSSVQSQSPNSYDWSRFDRLVTQANSKGLKVLPILAYTPAWARPSGCDSDKCAPADSGRFAQFVNAAVNRYKTKNIHIWEIWNEPNMIGFWQPHPNPAAYTTLLKDATITIRTCDRSAKVISGSLGSTDSSGGVPQLTFLQGIYKAGGKNYFDIVGFHPYSFPVLPTDYYVWNAWSQISQTPTSLHSIMVANGDATKSIWATEFGAPTGGPGAVATPTNYNFGHSPDHVNEALQSVIASSAISQYKASAVIGNFFWYSYQDIGTNRQSAENFYGLRRFDGTPKPAYQAFKSAVVSLKN